MEFQELLVRLSMLSTTLLAFVLFSNRKKRDTINPLLCVVPYCTFLLCILFSKTDIGLGIGFGLFAIFSILRFKTQSFTVNTIVFLFASITISIIDGLFPPQKWVFLLISQFLLIFVYILCVLINNDKTQIFSTSFETIFPLENAFDLNDLQAVISKTINKTNFDFTIISINFVSKQIVVKIFY